MMAMAPRFCEGALFVVAFVLLLVTQVTLSLSSSTAANTHPFSPPSAEQKPLCEAEIDYSAANEYVEAHYGRHQSPRTPYFGCSIRRESIYNARDGVRARKTGMLKPPTMESCGFTLLQAQSHQHPTPTQGAVTDWNNLSQIQSTLLPKLRNMLVKDVFRDCKIRDVIFWNPMLRGKDLKQTRPPLVHYDDDQQDDPCMISTPTASFAASPHIDTDIGAYDNAKDLVRLFERNRVDLDDDSSSSCSAHKSFRTSRLVNDIERERRRFAIVNAWCNIAETPLTMTSAPLGLLSVSYDDDMIGFPQVAPNMEESQWYSFPNMSKNEVLWFCQYDRDVTRPSDLWHCALTKTVEHVDDDNGDDRTSVAAAVASRSSFDVRCLVVFDEIVPLERDRFAENRLFSILTREESGCFCDKQAESRGIQQCDESQSS